jgi:hypothetical protein
MRLLIIVLNLKRRKDRRAWMEQTLHATAADEIIFLDAVDGLNAAQADDQHGTLHHHGYEFEPAPDWALSEAVSHKLHVCVSCLMFFRASKITCKGCSRKLLL